MTTIRTFRRTLRLTVVLAVMVAQPARAGLFGPDVELLPPSQIGERLHSETVLFNTGGTALQVKTKGAAIGGFFVGMLLSSAMASGGGGGATNAVQMNQQMQANMAIAQQANVNIQGVVTTAAASTSGQNSPTAAKFGPLPLLAQQLNRAFSEQQVAIADPATAPVPTLKLSLTQKTWMLDFSMASSDYTLSSALTMELFDTRAGKVHLRQTCTREYPKKMPLEAWERDDHQEVASAAEEIAQLCAEEFAVALNIPLPRQDASPTAPAENADEKSALAGEPLPVDAGSPQTTVEVLPPDNLPN